VKFIRQSSLWLTVAGAVLFAVAVVQNLAVRTLADDRSAYDAATLRRAARRFPHAARLQARLAEAELSDAGEGALPRAEAAALAATRLLPSDYKMWLLLGRVRQAQEDVAGEEATLRQSLALAPHYTEVRWLLANLLVRAGRTQEAIKEFSLAASVRPELLPASLDLVWQISGGDLSAVNGVAGEKPEAQLTLAGFLLRQSREQEAAAAFVKVDRPSRLASGQSAQFINTLIEQGRIQAARQLWFDTLGEPPRPIWNGGFEAERLKGFDQFDWAVGRTDYAAISVTSKQARSGAKSLRLTFTGQHTTRLNGEVRQLIPVKPGARYRLTCYAKAENLITSEGPTVAVTKPGLTEWIADSKPVAADTAEWQQLTTDFVAPQDTAVLLLTIKRAPKFSYDDPMTGTIWFDDFELREQ
jgi:tetratricopeptide (TPR) repeat protein